MIQHATVDDFKFLTPQLFSAASIPEIAANEQEAINHLAGSGFTVLKNCFEPKKVNKIKALFESSIINSNSLLPRITGFRKLEKNNLSSHGLMTNALMNMQLEDPDSYTDSENKFTRAILKLITRSDHINIIKSATGFDKLELITWNVFHSVSPLSIPHQDCVFFNPNSGILEIIGIWIALEDISPEASPLYLQRYSHINLRHKTKYMTTLNSEYLGFFKDNLTKNQHNIVSPRLQAGDCVLWDSRTTHGSLLKTNEEYSRLSITAHFRGRELSPIKRAFRLPCRQELSALKQRFYNSLEIKRYNETSVISGLAHRKRINS